MNTIILASHGELSQGMKQTASMILGSEIAIFAVSAFRDDEEPIGEQIEKLLKIIESEEIYLLTDILGGSVNNELLVILQKYPQLQLITGMNLPLVIAIATQVGPLSEEQLQEIINESRQSLVNCKTLLASTKSQGRWEL